MITNPVGMRLTILRFLQERVGEVGMTRFILHSTDNHSLQTEVIEGLESTINAMVLFTGLPPLLTVFGANIRSNPIMDTYFTKYPIYIKWKAHRDLRNKAPDKQDRDRPFVSQLAQFFNLNAHSDFLSLLQRDLTVFVKEWASDIARTIDILNKNPKELVDFFNQNHNRIEFPLELTDINPHVYSLLIPTIFVEWAVISSTILQWNAYKRIQEMNIRNQITSRKGVEIPILKDVDLKELPYKEEVGDAIKSINRLNIHGETDMFLTDSEVQQGSKFNMFGFSHSISKKIFDEVNPIFKIRDIVNLSGIQRRLSFRFDVDPSSTWWQDDPTLIDAELSQDYFTERDTSQLTNDIHKLTMQNDVGTDAETILGTDSTIPHVDQGSIRHVNDFMARFFPIVITFRKDFDRIEVLSVFKETHISQL